MSDTDSMLTTVDNPYNPFTEFDAWLAYDTQKGYGTCNYLARIVRSSPELSDEIEESIIASAIDEIIDFNLSGIHLKVTKDGFAREIEEAKKHLKAE